MRISDSKDLGELLQKRFKGELIIDELGTIQVTNLTKTTKEEIMAAITEYYIKTLGCESRPDIPSFNNSKGYEAISLSYFQYQDELLLTIIEI